MADPRATVHVLMRGLVRRYFEKQSCAAKEMADFWHPNGNCGEDYDTAALSRKMNGSRQWDVTDVMALTAITGSNRVLVAMHMGVEDDRKVELSPLQHMTRLIKESGEGAVAIMAMAEGGSIDDARAELTDVAEAVQDALAMLDAQSHEELSNVTVPIGRRAAI